MSLVCSQLEGRLGREEYLFKKTLVWDIVQLGECLLRRQKALCLDLGDVLFKKKGEFVIGAMAPR